MGLFDRFGGSKTERLVKKVTNPWVQTQDRQRAMELLADIGDDEALFGLLKRFTFRTEGSIVDDDEKRLAHDLLVHAGPKAIGPIERYCRQFPEVYWPLQALKKLAGPDAAVEILLKALDEAEKVQTRVNEHKRELVANLRDFPHDRVRDRLKVLCTDPDEEVRVRAIDALCTYGPEVAVETLAQRILAEDESPSVKAVIFEQLVESGWSLAPWRDEILDADVLPSFYSLSPKGILLRG